MSARLTEIAQMPSLRILDWRVDDNQGAGISIDLDDMRNRNVRLIETWYCRMWNRWDKSTFEEILVPDLVSAAPWDR
jgi:hypothetical protein